MDLLKANNAIIHLGGARTMATQIVSNARSAGLDVAYDFPTMGDGNCFYTSVTQQMKRTDVKNFLDPHLIFIDSHQLRIAVVGYVLRESCKQNTYIQQYKNHYEEILHAENQQRSWLDFLHHQANNAVYATELFIKGTAVFLGIDIHINTPGCNSSRPYNVVSRFWQNSHEAVNNSPAAMLLGNICDIHFQSLIFCNEQSVVDFTVIQQPTYAMITKIEKNHNLIPEDNKGYKTQPHEPNLNAKNNSISHINIKAIPSLFNSSKLRKVINNATAFQNVNMKPLSENNFDNNVEQFNEQSLLKSCSEFNGKYIKPSKNENQKQCYNRRRKIRRNIADAKLKNKRNYTIQHQHTNATVQQHKDTIDTLPNTDKSVNTTNVFEPCITNNLQQEPTIPENVNINQGLSYIHHNEQVVSAVQQFEVGELQHTIQTCAVCFQTRPVFNATTFQSPLQQNVSSIINGIYMVAKPPCSI